VTWAERFLLPVQHHQGCSVFPTWLNIGLFCACPETGFLGEGETRAVTCVLLPLLEVSACPGLCEPAALLWEGRAEGSAAKNLLVLAQRPAISCLKLSFMLSLPLPPAARPMQYYEVCGCSQGYWAAGPQQRVLGGRRHAGVKWWRLGQLPDMEL